MYAARPASRKVERRPPPHNLLCDANCEVLMPARIPANVREQQIDSLHNISFVRWDGEFKSNKSYAVVRCRSDGFEWRASVHNLVNNGHKCPECSNVRKWTARSEEHTSELQSH